MCVCVQLTHRIRVQSLRLSPPTWPVAGFKVIKPSARDTDNDRADEEDARPKTQSPSA